MKKIPDGLAGKLLRRAVRGGCDYADVFIERKVHLSLQLEDDKMEKVVSGVDSGLGMRVVTGTTSSYAYSNDFSEKSLLELADTVSGAAKQEKGASINLKKIRPGTDFTIELFPDKVGMDRKVSVIDKANRTARKVSPNITQVRVLYRDSVQNVYIATSEGTVSEDERVQTVGIVQAVASDGDILQTGYEPAGGFVGFELFQGDLFEELSLRAAQKAVAMLKARKIAGGRMPVVISSDAGGTMIHEAVGHGLEADLVQQGLSVYADRIGQQIASSLITVVDDATLQKKRGSFRFDDEGIRSRRNVLVDRGILKGYLYDRLTARKGRVTSTGNGRRESYESRPIPRMTNTFIEPGTSDPGEIVKSVHRGLFVKRMGGGQVNTVTGEFVFEVTEGYLIENGAIAETVRGATLIGNGPDVLKSIDMVGSDLGFSIGTCGKDAQGVPVSDGMPTVRIPEIVVGGNVEASG